MTWLLQLLLDAVREMVMQFMVDSMDLISGMFTEILSCDLNLFEELFGVAGELYRNAVIPIGIALLFLICIWKLYQSMFGKLGVSSEDPIELVLRSGFCLFLILYGKDLVNYILEIAGTPYQWIAGTEIAVTSFSEYSSTAESILGALGIDALSIQLLLLIMQVVVAWNYFKVLFVIAERYVLLGVLSYTAPIAFATGGSRATGNILSSWLRMFGGQVIIVLLDVWCLKLFLSAYGNLASSSYGFTKFFAATMCLIGFCKIIMKLDSYMAALGVSMGRTAGGLSGLGALMIAGRLLRGGGYSGGGKAAAGAMAYGNGRSIPLRNPWGGMPDRAGASGMDKKTGTGTDESGQRAGFGFQGEEGEKFRGASDAPFGMPEEQADANIIGVETASKEVQGQTMEAAEMTEDIGSSRGESGSLPFGEPEEEDTGGIDMPFGVPDEPEYPQEGYGENGLPFSDREAAEAGADAMGDNPFGMSGQMEALDEENAASSTSGSEFLGTEGYSEMEEAGSIADGVGEPGYASGELAGMPEYIDAFEAGGPAYEGAGESVSHTEAMALGEGTAEGASAGYGFDIGVEGANTPAVLESGLGGHASYLETAERAAGTMEGRLQINGAHEIERDGSRYMRYDGSLFEKPQSKYQTIHENGKTYYEIPKGEKAPAVLPELRIVLGKDGSIQVKKEYKRPSKEKPSKEKQKRLAKNRETLASKGRKEKKRP